MDDGDRLAIRDFVARHGLTLKDFSAHAGLPYSTVYMLMRRPGPGSEAVRSRIAVALALTPPPRLLKHEAVVRRLWGREAREAIAVYLGVSPQRISFIARRLGLPPLRGGNDGSDKSRAGVGVSPDAAAE